MVEIRLLVQESVKGGGVGGFGGGGIGEGGCGVNNFFPHPTELLIWAYPVNLVKIGLMVKEEDLGGRAKSVFIYPNKCGLNLKIWLKSDLWFKKW